MIDGISIGDLHYVGDASETAPDGSETVRPDDRAVREFGFFELKRAQMWTASCVKFFAFLAGGATFAVLTGIPATAAGAVAVALTFGFTFGKRLQLPEIYVIFLPDDYTETQAVSLSDNLSNFIGNRGEWTPVTSDKQYAGKLLRHNTNQREGGEFVIGDLFITTRLVAVDASNATGDGGKREECRDQSLVDYALGQARHRRPRRAVDRQGGRHRVTRGSPGTGKSATGISIR